MDNKTIQLLIVVGIPFLTLVVCWIYLMKTMKETTGELKHWLTPENVVKGVTIVFVIVSILALGVLDILKGDLIATILSGIIGYTLGVKFFERQN